MRKEPVDIDDMLSIGGNDVQIDSACSREEWIGNNNAIGTAGKPTVRELDASLRTNIKFNITTEPRTASNVDKRPVPAPPPRQANPASRLGQSLFKKPMPRSGLAAGIVESARPGTPKHDPDAEGALVMPRPKSLAKGKRVVDVVVDPILARKLRPHQRAGVTFLYECVMGMRSYPGEGAILADDMGLGKTMQVIALIWTLLKQSPFVEDDPIARKIMIVCPVSLIENWRKEFRKWLGRDRIGIYVVDDKARVNHFTLGKAYSVMIIGYEKLRTVQADLQKGPGIDLIIMDEGHRLKTAKNKSSQVIKALPSAKRIVLSGTPIQNDLSELYFVVDLINPGLLGTAAAFKREFEKPIDKSRQPEASAKEREKGDGKYQDLMDTISQFVLRRTADILAEFLPPKTEYVLFCKPTSVQATIYREVLASPAFNSILGSSEAALQLINVLKKLCNSPSLLKSRDSSGGEESSRSTLIETLLSQLDPKHFKSAGASGKLRVLDALLYTIRSKTDEKVVLVSNYTATLDILGKLLDGLSYTWIRLDGSTPQNKRMGIVDRFNNASAEKCFAFLLSAKSGGVGLNLVGASRLILFDVDWNPSTDLQAMARIHRDGQTRPCRIYRLLTRGALDEKIYQRQLTKQGLADAVIDNKSSVGSFTRDELKNLFSLDDASECQTHDLLGCKCGGAGGLETESVRGASAGSASPSAGHDSRTAKDGEDDEADSDDDDDQDDNLPDLPALISASQVNVAEQDRRYHASQRRRAERAQRARRKSRAAGAGTADEADDGATHMPALMQYRHVDVARLTGSGSDAAERAALAARLDDDVLLEVLQAEENRVGFLFARRSAVFGAASEPCSPGAESGEGDGEGDGGEFERIEDVEDEDEVGNGKENGMAVVGETEDATDEGDEEEPQYAAEQAESGS